MKESGDKFGHGTHQRHGDMNGVIEEILEDWRSFFGHGLFEVIVEVWLRASLECRRVAPRNVGVE